MHLAPCLRARTLHPNDPRLRIPTYLRRGRSIPGVNAPAQPPAPVSPSHDA